MNNCIVMGGMGQVGSALAKILSRRNVVYTLEKDSDVKPPVERTYDFLHVAIPYSRHFCETVRNAVKRYRPKYIVIHSTVPVGTTSRLGANAAHSPVRGNHPDLVDGLLGFVKYVGAKSQKTRNAVVAHLMELGINVQGWSRPEETELNKLMCLSRYLNDLAFYEMAFKLCRRFRVAPVRLYQWTYTYNDGYKGTKHRRPELSFPRGKVGGHCVLPVANMLYHQAPYAFFKANLDVFSAVER